ncbi:MAG: glycosyltransferase family 4 protein [Lachnospiraceae bacterium]|nr:glycosyltransferase family 4 protein [Lachnospiraceae bacterium]
MKILLASDWYAPVVNGVVTSVLNLKKGLEEKGHEVKVVTLSPTTKSYVDGDVTYIGSANAGFVYPNARIRIKKSTEEIKELIRWQPDVVHTNCEMSTFLIARKIAKILNIPVVHTYHTVYEDYTNYFSPSKKVGVKLVAVFSKKIAQKTDCVIVPSAKVSALLKNYGVEQPIHVVPTGIEPKGIIDDPQKTKEIRNQLNIPQDHIVLVYLGRMAKEKNCIELLDMFSQCKSDKITLVMVGDGPYKKNIEEHVEEIGLSGKVIFTGMVSPKEVGYYYHLGDVFVSASTSETQGLTYYEALFAGRPMLCKKDEALDGIVEENVNGWLFTNAEEFTQAIDRINSNPDILEAMSKKSLEIVAKYSVDNFATSIETIYKSYVKSEETRTLETNVLNGE